MSALATQLAQAQARIAELEAQGGSRSAKRGRVDDTTSSSSSSSSSSAVDEAQRARDAASEIAARATADLWRAEVRLARLRAEAREGADAAARRARLLLLHPEAGAGAAAEARVRGDLAASGRFLALLPPPPARLPHERAPVEQAAVEEKLFKAFGLVGGLGFWEAWRLPQVCRELRFGFSGGGAPADMIKLGLEKQGVWAMLQEARAARRDEGEWTRLHHACFAVDDAVQRVCELVELGWPGSVEARDAGRWTPLMWASNRGHAGIVKSLLAAGVDVNAANNNGWTALIYACRHGHLESVRILVAAKALVNARSNVGYTPLNCARGYKGATANPAIEALLLAAGATM